MVSLKGSMKYYYADIEHSRERGREYAKRRRDSLPEEVKRIRRVSMQKRNSELKLEVYTLLGGKCVHCDYVGAALQIDISVRYLNVVNYRYHIDGGGCKEARRGNTYYAKVKKSILAGENRYQLLCANCNWEKRLANKEAPILPWV